MDSTAARWPRGLIGHGRWPVAVAEVALAIAAGFVLPRLELHYRWHDGVAYETGAAQATLAAIAGGMITLTGFVLTAVTLIVQTVQSQSPRLLRFLDRTDNTPLLFGTFTATFTFALVVLGEMKTSAVPSVSVTIAEVLVLISVCLFLRLLVTFRTTLTVGGLTRSLGDQLRRLIDQRYPAPFGAPDSDDSSGDPGEVDDRGRERVSWHLPYLGAPGVFQGINESAAVRLAASAGAEIRLIPAVGDFLVTGAPLATGIGTSLSARDLTRVVHVDRVRTIEREPTYGIRLLADIAIRALSAAVNDPTSAVQALDQLDDVLHRLAVRSLGDGRLRDASGHVRVRCTVPGWEAFLSLAVDEIMLYGSGTLQVARRLRALLNDLLTAAPPGRRDVLRARLDTLDRLVRQEFPDPRVIAEAMEPDRQGIGSPRGDDRHKIPRWRPRSTA